MFRQFLVVFVFQNGVFSNNDNSLPTSALMQLISKIIENDKQNNIQYEKIGDRDLAIDLEYYDFNINNNYKRQDVISSDLEDEEESSKSEEVRIHVIQNPEVLEQYQNLLYYKRRPSNAEPEFHAKIYKALTLEDIISHLRRNALDTASNEKREENKNEEKRQRSQNINSNEKKDKLNDDSYRPKAEKDDWDIPKKNNKENNIIENRSKDKNRNSDIEWGSKKKNNNFMTEKKLNPSWDDDYPKKDKPRNKETNYKPFDTINDNYKDRKLSKSIDNYKESNYKPQKYNNYRETDKRKDTNFYRPLRLSEHFKPHYKPYPSDSEKKSNRNDNYKPPPPLKRKPAYKESKPAYKETNYNKPRIIKNDVERRPREKHIDRVVLGGTYGRTPIPYVGHRGVYEEK